MKKKVDCKHDYENAIKVGNIDYVCPLCGKFLDPREWFIMNYFKTVEVKGEIIEKFLSRKQGKKLSAEGIINCQKWQKN